MLFDWLLEQINDWLSPTEMDSTVGVVDIYGFEVGIQLGHVCFQMNGPEFSLSLSLFLSLLCRTWQ